MSQAFINYTAVPFQGTLINQGVGICLPTKSNPTIVKAQIDWAKYPLGCVEINIAGNAALQKIDYIRSIVIDNTVRLSNVNVFFPDTSFTQVCAADSIVSGYALTFQLKCLVFNERINEPGLSTIYFCNFLLDSFTQQANPSAIALWQMSSSGATAENDQVYHAPVLGSQFQSIAVDLGNTVTQQNILQSPNSSGRFYITGMDISAVNAYSSTASYKNMAIQIKDITNGTIPYFVSFMAPNDVSIIPALLLDNTTSKFFSLDARHTFVIQNTADVCPGGFVFWKIYFDWISND